MLHIFSANRPFFAEPKMNLICNMNSLQTRNGLYRHVRGIADFYNYHTGFGHGGTQQPLVCLHVTQNHLDCFFFARETTGEIMARLIPVLLFALGFLPGCVTKTIYSDVEIKDLRNKPDFKVIYAATVTANYKGEEFKDIVKEEIGPIGQDNLKAKLKERFPGAEIKIIDNADSAVSMELFRKQFYDKFKGDGLAFIEYTYQVDQIDLRNGDVQTSQLETHARNWVWLPFYFERIFHETEKPIDRGVHFNRIVTEYLKK